MNNPRSLLERFATTPLGALFADNDWVPIEDASLSWLNLPPPEFLEYVVNTPRPPYEAIPNDPKLFTQAPTFLITQAHRIWLTLQQIDRHLPADGDRVLLDLGAYPFSMDTAIRRYLKRSCRIVATVNQELSSEDRRWLEEDGIEIIPVNLDPLVKADPLLPGMTDTLPFPDQSVDFVLFAHVIEHLYHPLQVMTEAARVLKPGGKMLVSTDNAFLIGGLLNYLTGGPFVHEPVQATSAMLFNQWRGHVRFFSGDDLRGLLEKVGLSVIETELAEAIYNALIENYFVQPYTGMPRWRVNLLRDFPYLQNEILVVAQKPEPGRKSIPSSPFDPSSYAAEIRRLDEEFRSGRCESGASTSLDQVFGCRLLFGRWPTAEELASYREQPPERGVDGLVERLLSSDEFRARRIGVGLNRPGHNAIVMAETSDKLRFFFGIRDTFVGLPIAIDVYEPELREALLRLLRPGMNCVDVGANLGYYSILFARAVAEGGGEIFSFEPESFAYSLLERNRAENRYEDVISISQVACGDVDGEARLYRAPNPENYGGAFLRTPGQKGYQASTGDPVPVERIDSLIPPGTRIDLVKINAVGYEPFILRGMSRLIQDCAPILVCRFNTVTLDFDGPDAPNRFLKELASLDYSVFDAAKFGAGTIVPFEYSGSGYCSANLICLPGARNPMDFLQPNNAGK